MHSSFAILTAIVILSAQDMLGTLASSEHKKKKTWVSGQMPVQKQDEKKPGLGIKAKASKILQRGQQKPLIHDRIEATKTSASQTPISSDSYLEKIKELNAEERVLKMKAEIELLEKKRKTFDYLDDSDPYIKGIQNEIMKKETAIEAIPKGSRADTEAYLKAVNQLNANFAASSFSTTKPATETWKFNIGVMRYICREKIIQTAFENKRKGLLSSLKEFIEKFLQEDPDLAHKVGRQQDINFIFASDVLDESDRKSIGAYCEAINNYNTEELED